MSPLGLCTSLSLSPALKLVKLVSLKDRVKASITDLLKGWRIEMGHHCCSKQKVKRGLWSPEEDEKLIRHITTHGHSSWSSVPKLAGLQRCGKSCRLRWINYLKPDLKRGCFSEEEEQIIIDVHRILGNRWAQIAKHLPGRTDNEVKNFWNSCIKKKMISQGLDPKTHNLFSSHQRSTTSNRIASNLSQTNQQPISILSVNPPFVTLPPLPPTQPLFKDQNPLFWTVKDQNSHELISFPCGSSIESTPICSSSSSSVNPSVFGFLDENCILGTTSINERYEPPRVLEEHQQKEEPKVVQEMDTSFDSSSFDLEFMESTLMSGTMDDIAWNF